MPPRLSSTDAFRLNTALGQLYAATTLELYPARALSVVGQLIECIHLSYNEIDLSLGSHRALVEPLELVRHEFTDAFAAYLHQHPVIAHSVATGDGRSHLITDFLTQSQYRRLELYGEFFRPLGTEAQLSTSFSANQGKTVIGLALNRGREGFRMRDRALLDLLRPHLLVSYDNARQLSAALTAADGQGRRGGSAAILNRLTGRQHEILALVANGFTNTQIALELDISVATAKKHLENIRGRLGVSTRTAAAAYFLTTSNPISAAGWTPTIEL